VRLRLTAAAAIVLTASIALTACTGGSEPAPVVSGSAAASSSSGSATASSTPSPSATISAAAQAALGKFDAANKQIAASTASPTDAQIVSALVAAGFAKSAMEITADQTTIGRHVDSIEVAVKVGPTCLLGGFNGNAYSSETAPVLSTGKCLVGNTAPIS
jgi:hypothetical protein